VKSVLAFGEALIDLLQEPDRPGLYRRHAGGAPANVAVGVARLGGHGALMGMLGHDSFGDFLAGELRRYGVDGSWLHRTAAAPTALAVVSLDAQGERSFSFYRPPAADLLITPQLVDPAAFADAPCLHLCSNSLTHEPARGATLRALELAHLHGCLVSLDINWRPGLWPAGTQARSLLTPLLHQAHVLKFSAEEWDWLDAGGNLARHCFGGKAELLVVTDGPNPVRTLTRHGAATHAVPSCAAVDTTAAGDAFVAGLLYRLCAQDLGPAQLAQRLRDGAWLAQQVAFAARCGARACMSYGAFAALPALAEVSEADALAAHALGFDIIGTTLSGYTGGPVPEEPDYELIARLAAQVPRVMAEGRIHTPRHVAEARLRGAWAVTVGTAITRTELITQWFARAMGAGAAP